jgi:hypothetical protein
MKIEVIELRRAFKNVPNLTALTFDDESVVHAALRGSQWRYSSSWLYTLRTSHVEHGLAGYKYISNDLVAFVGFRHNCLYVTAAYDLTHGVALHKLCRTLVKVTGARIILKKFSDELYNQCPYEEISNSVLREDDTCPETKIELQKLFIGPDLHINPVTRKLARRARAFEQREMRLDIVTDIQQVPLAALELFLAQDINKYASYIQILRYLAERPENIYQYRTMVFLSKGVVRGLYMAEVLSLTDLGLYGAITSKDIGGITEWMDIYFFRAMIEHGTQTIFLGGAENSGIAQYITKLIPYKPFYATRAVLFNSQLRNQQPKTTIRLATEQDIFRLSRLYLHAYNGMDTLGERWTVKSAHRFIAHFYRRQPDLFFVAEKHGKIVGAAVAAVQPWWDGYHLVEGEVILDPSFEPSEADLINRLLLRKLLNTASHQYNVVSWDTIIPTVPEHPLANFEHIGFTKVLHWAAVTGDTHIILKHLNDDM